MWHVQRNVYYCFYWQKKVPMRQKWLCFFLNYIPLCLFNEKKTKTFTPSKSTNIYIPFASLLRINLSMNSTFNNGNISTSLLNEYSVILTTSFYTYGMNQKQDQKIQTKKKLISKISVDSNFAFSSYAWLGVFHCSNRLVLNKSLVSRLFCENCFISYRNDFTLIPLGKYAS